MQITISDICAQAGADHGVDLTSLDAFRLLQTNSAGHMVCQLFLRWASVDFTCLICCNQTHFALTVGHELVGFVEIGVFQT